MNKTSLDISGPPLRFESSVDSLPTQTCYCVSEFYNTKKTILPVPVRENQAYSAVTSVTGRLEIS